MYSGIPNEKRSNFCTLVRMLLSSIEFQSSTLATFTNQLEARPHTVIPVTRTADGRLSLISEEDDCVVLAIGIIQYSRMNSAPEYGAAAH